MTTEEAIKIGDLIIDEHTGEILQLPEGIGEPLAWLTHKANEAIRASKTWEGIGGMYKKALGELLNQAGVKSIKTEYGAPGWRERKNVRARVDRLPQVIEDFELDHGDLLGLLMCVSGLDVKRLNALKGLPDGAKEKLIDEQPSTMYVQITPAAPMPPPIESVTRPRTEAQS